MSKKPQCKDCRFFDIADGRVGYCHRRAPTTNQHGNPSWPLLGAHNWCGEYDSTPPQTEKREAE